MTHKTETPENTGFRNVADTGPLPEDSERNTALTPAETVEAAQPDADDEFAAFERHDEPPFGSAVPVVTPQLSKARPMQKARFLLGLLLSTLGVGLMLIVAAGALQNAGMNGRLSLPAVGLCMIIGLMLLGGGFGTMATAAPTFDDDEFDRLMRAGDPPDTCAEGVPNDNPVLQRDKAASPGPRDTQRPHTEQSVA